MIIEFRKLYKSIFLFAFLLISKPLFSQIKGKVIEEGSKHPISFAHIIINNGERHFISDIDGQFEIADTSYIKLITFSSHLHKRVSISTDTLTKPLEIQIPVISKFEFETNSSPSAMLIMDKVFSFKMENEIIHLKYISYTSYNKSTLTPEKVDNTNRSLDKIFKFLSINFNRLKDNQHFLLSESVTERRIYNKTHQKETIKGARSTILDVPYLFVQTTQLQAFSPYEDFVKISNKVFVSPLAKDAYKRYVFNLIDTIPTNTDTVYVIKYNPIPGKPFNGLKGNLYISSKKYAVEYFSASPGQEMKLIMEAYQSYKHYEEKGIWFPDRTKTRVVAKKSGEAFTATLDTYIQNVDLNHFSQKKEFDEVILHYPQYANQQDEEFWKSKRSVPLTKTDSNTYHYYSSIDKRKYIQRSFQIGENIYYGIFTHKKLDIDLKHLMNANHQEGVRIGFGAHTNEKFSHRFIVGGYLAYGFKDEVTKLGADVTYKVRTLPVSFNSSLNYDLEEAGGINFAFSRYQYSSEPLRIVNLRMMDYVTKWENSASIHPLKFLDTKISYSISSNSPSYNYQYKGIRNDKYDFSELKIGAKYAYGERYIQLLDRKISSGSEYPIIYFTYTKGFKNFLGGDYNYGKIEAKAEYNISILDWGTLGIQLIGGYVHGDAPYSKLFNGTGSLRNFSPVIHNSFETMQYNEFLSDRYLSIFLSHNFGRLYYKSNFIKPNLIVLHNMGFGGLRHPEFHKQILFKTMEKGYIESGFAVDELLVLKLIGLKTGFGPGFFLRYGPYANPQFINNFVVKLAVKFSL